MKFLLDVNTGGTLYHRLTELGHDVVKVGEKDPRMRDDEVLRWAVKERRIIVTTDKDFEELIWRQARHHCGLLRLENLPRDERLSLLRYVMDHHNQDLESGAIVIASKNKLRIRKRPV